jgi:hypothetical protein
MPLYSLTKYYFSIAVISVQSNLGFADHIDFDDRAWKFDNSLFSGRNLRTSDGEHQLDQFCNYYTFSY